MTPFRRTKNLLLRRLWTGSFRQRPCSHRDQIREVRPSAEVCDECVALGDSWPALRICLTCGYVGCCDKAKNRHALQHYQSTGHPIVRPYKERGMDWLWCRVDKVLLDPI